MKEVLMSQMFHDWLAQHMVVAQGLIQWFVHSPQGQLIGYSLMLLCLVAIVCLVASREVAS